MEHASAIRILALCAITVTMMLIPSPSRAQQLQGDALVKALQHGGYVIVMRHASSPGQKPDAQAADPENANGERQLDEQGRNSATAFGKALRDLKIPVGEVLSSPTYRALETARYARLPTPRAVPELGDNGQSMQGTSQTQAAWLQNRVTQFPSRTNTILITHLPNIAAAFPQFATGLADGEALVFGPDGKGAATIVARVKIDDWPKMTPQ